MTLPLRAGRAAAHQVPLAARASSSPAIAASYSARNSGSCAASCSRARVDGQQHPHRVVRGLRATAGSRGGGTPDGRRVSSSTTGRARARADDECGWEEEQRRRNVPFDRIRLRYEKQSTKARRTRVDQRREARQVDVAAGDDRDDLAAAGPAAERRGDRAGGRAFGDDVHALGRAPHRRPHLVERDDDRVVDQRCSSGHIVGSTDLPPAPSTNDAVHFSK